MAKRTRYFQWVEGESKGKVVALVSIYEFDGEYFYEFDDGESCNLRFIAPMTIIPSEIKNKAIVEIFSPAYAWKIETISTHKAKVFDEEKGEILVDVPPIEDILKAGGQQEVTLEDSALGKTKMIPPVKPPYFEELPKIEDYMQQETVIEVEPEPIPVTNVKQVEVKETKPVVKEQVDSSDPVRILVNTCKKHSTSISMTVDIDLPKKSIYELADEEFENGGERFISHLISDIDTTVIVDALKAALISAYSGK